MDAWKQIYEKRLAAMGYVPRTLCELCGNACGGCRWSKAGVQQPVTGWEALRRDIKMEGEMVESYVVLDCPEYKPELRWWLYVINWDKDLARYLATVEEEVGYG